MTFSESKKGSRKMPWPNPSETFRLLFANAWPARRLDAAIERLDIAALAAEYHDVARCAPHRAEQSKEYFVEHDGTTAGGDSSNRREEHLARAICDREARWPWSGGGWLRPLDYQVPLKSRQNDVGIGKVDILGVTDSGQIVVVELKISGARNANGAGAGRGDSPMAALMEALRYSAIVQANHFTIADEAWRKFSAKVSDDVIPAILLLGTDDWWRSWLTCEAAGSWIDPFIRLLGQIEKLIGAPVGCLAITADRQIVPVGAFSRLHVKT